MTANFPQFSSQQQKVALAEALAFVAPVHFLSFPAMLKGWLDRVWTPGFAYDLTPEAGLRGAMRMVIDEFTLTYPRIKNVEREYFYALHGADARLLGKALGLQF